MTRTFLMSVALASLVAGCGGGYGLRCEDPERYSGSAEVPPVRVPGDLSVPDETDALRIPQPEQLGAPEATSRRGRCLESPPDYFESEADTAPAAEDEEPSA